MISSRWTADRRVAALAAIAVVALGTLPLARLAVIVLQRVAYPFELEWMEGSMVDHVGRVLRGEPIYVAPSLAFAPYLYTPLFYYVSAGVALVTGLSPFPLRLVSVTASLVCFGLLYVLARRETGSRAAGVLAAGLFAATYRLGGAWFDLARVDMLFLALLLGAATLIRSRDAAGALVGAGVLIVLAFLTKQVALVMAAPLVGWVLVRDWRRGMLLAATVAAGTIGSVLILDVVHDGWFRFYTFTVPGGHATEWPFLRRFWTDDLWRLVWPMSTVALGTSLAAANRLRRDRSWDRLFLPAALAGTIVGSWMGRLHSGGFENVVIPAYATLSLAFAVGLTRLVRTSARPLITGALAASLLLVQFRLLHYDARPLVPTVDDVRAGFVLIDELRGVEGDVWLFDHGYLPSLAGRPVQAPSAALWDILRADTGVVGERLRHEIDLALESGRFHVIIIDSFREFPADLWSRYWEDAPVFAHADHFWPVTGFRKRPEFVFRRYEPTSDAAETADDPDGN